MREMFSLVRENLLKISSRGNVAFLLEPGTIGMNCTLHGNGAIEFSLVSRKTKRASQPAGWAVLLGG